MHHLMQHTIQECTLYVNVFCLKISHNTDGKSSSQCCISTSWSPCLEQINSVDLLKTLSNVSGLKSLDLTPGASLDLQSPFGRQRPTPSGQLTEFEYSVLAKGVKLIQHVDAMQEWLFNNTDASQLLGMLCCLQTLWQKANSRKYEPCKLYKDAL